MTSSVGIVGGGMVGGAVKSFFPDAKVYDKYKNFDSIIEVGKAKFIFLCVPTPHNDKLDLSIMNDAVENTIKHLVDPSNQLLVIKSTVWPGIAQSYQDRYPQANFAFNPEFLRDQTASADFAKPDRQIIGYTKKTKDSPMLVELLEILPKAKYQKIVPAEVAEIMKYAANTFLAMQVVFANQIYDISQAAGIDYEQVKEIIKADKRIGKSHWEIMHTEASIESTRNKRYRGYGGKCFPKDINSFIKEGRKLGVDVSLFEAARDVNLVLNGGHFDG